jgi:transcriptional regulator with XRE-family HTH domain
MKSLRKVTRELHANKAGRVRMMIGERLRETRHSQQLSLTDVAGKAGISAATLSRIETDKQGVDLGLFLLLARILKAVPHELLSDTTAEKSASDPLVKKIAGLGASERTKLWRELAVARRTRKSSRRELSQQVEELVAQLEYVQQEINSVRITLRKR